jgi:signal transduction histidine kinase
LEEQEAAAHPGLHQVAAAAENALYESRRAISALTDPIGESLDVALGKLAADITQREGLDLDLRVQPNIHVPAAVHEQVLRIAREAMTNAVRHGDPAKITIELQNMEGLSLAIEDDGRGFLVPDSQAASDGFGLVSMKERAKALSGSLKVRSRPGSGTRVEVLIPEV